MFRHSFYIILHVRKKEYQEYHIINLIPHYYYSRKSLISIHPSNHFPTSIHVAVNYYKRCCYIVKAIKFITRLRSSIKPTSYLEIKISIANSIFMIEETSQIAFSHSVSKHVISHIFGKTSFKLLRCEISNCCDCKDRLSYNFNARLLKRNIEQFPKIKI